MVAFKARRVAQRSPAPRSPPRRPPLAARRGVAPAAARLPPGSPGPGSAGPPGARPRVDSGSPGARPRLIARSSARLRGGSPQLGPVARLRLRPALSFRLPCGAGTASGPGSASGAGEAGGERRTDERTTTGPCGSPGGGGAPRHPRRPPEPSPAAGGGDGVAGAGGGGTHGDAPGAGRAAGEGGERWGLVAAGQPGLGNVAGRRRGGTHGRTDGSTASPGQRFQNRRNLFPVLWSKGNRYCAGAALLDKNKPDRFARCLQQNQARFAQRN